MFRLPNRRAVVGQILRCPHELPLGTKWYPLNDLPFTRILKISTKRVCRGVCFFKRVRHALHHFLHLIPAAVAIQHLNLLHLQFACRDRSRLIQAEHIDSGKRLYSLHLLNERVLFR